MPLGDSITQGGANEGGYRGPLERLLTAAGVYYTMVGSQSSGNIFQPANEGHGGQKGLFADSGG